MKGRNALAQLSSEDVKLLTVSPQQHDCLILGSQSLLQGLLSRLFQGFDLGTTLTELQEAVSSCSAGDALAVSTAVGLKAKSRQVQKGSDKACWVQSEREEKEITCCAVLLHHGEALEKDAAQQVAWEPKDGQRSTIFSVGEEAACGSRSKAHGAGTEWLMVKDHAEASLAQAAERAAEKRWEKLNEVTAVGAVSEPHGSVSQDPFYQLVRLLNPIGRSSGCVLT